MHVQWQRLHRPRRRKLCLPRPVATAVAAAVAAALAAALAAAAVAAAAVATTVAASFTAAAAPAAAAPAAAAAADAAEVKACVLRADAPKLAIVTDFGQQVSEAASGAELLSEAKVRDQGNAVTTLTPTVQLRQTPTRTQTP